VGWGGDEERPPDSAARLEVANGLRQTDRVNELALDGMLRGFTLTPAIVRELHAIAMAGVVDSAGLYRTFDKPRPIVASRHQPPAFSQVPGFVDEMCAYVNDRPATPFPASGVTEDEVDRAVHVGSYVLWRLNWIHPFEDGNGRTSRALCYLLLCVHVRTLLPGDRSFAERIKTDSRKYYNCLEDADRGHGRGKQIRVQNLEQFVRRHFVAQVRSFKP
jgi:Fic family protein